MNTTQLTILGFLLLFLGTTLGSSVVLFVRKELSHKWNSLFLGFAAGIMIAASVWSLLIPAIDAAGDSWGDLSWIPAAIGFLLGGLFLVLLDRVIPHIHGGTNQEEGPSSQIHKSLKLFFAVTI
ncbi:MAG: ZIP family metal transporter, partial [Tidjanibacter sp.]|nr:ZIP family metal transporter [Tidjanibacter sp.]